jgi:DNA-binding NarL/FixJ family response regulator
MPRVLMGDFGALIRVGLEDLLRDEHIRLLATMNSDLLDGLLTTLPDVVLIDLDHEDSDDLAYQISALYPAVRIIACSTIQSTMRVYPPFHHGEWHESALEAETLADEVNS